MKKYIVAESERLQEYKKLFQAVLDAPEDHSVKLVFADWLEEHDLFDLGYTMRWCAAHGMFANLGWWHGKPRQNAEESILSDNAKTFRIDGWVYAASDDKEAYKRLADLLCEMKGFVSLEPTNTKCAVT